MGPEGVRATFVKARERYARCEDPRKICIVRVHTILDPRKYEEKIINLMGGEKEKGRERVEAGNGDGEKWWGGERWRMVGIKKLGEGEGGKWQGWETDRVKGERLGGTVQF